MNRHEFYDKLNTYKILQHSSKYGDKYYTKIDKYYPDGSARYFYTRQEWEAYQKDKGQDEFRKQQEQKKKAEQKADMTGYKDWKQKEDKNKKYEEKYKNTDTYKQETAKQKEIDRINKLKQDVKDAWTNPDDPMGYKTSAYVLLDSPEGKALAQLVKKMYEENYPDKMSVGEINTKLCSSNEYKKLKEIDPDVAINALWYATSDVEKKIKILKNSVNSREQAEREGVISNKLSSNDPEVVQEGVNMVYHDYIDFINNAKSDRLYTTEEMNEITSNYMELLNSMSILRSAEEKDPKNGLPKMANKMTAEEAMEYINPGRKSLLSELEGGGNCRLCTLAMDLRMRGYDVSAPNVTDADEGFEKGGTVDKVFLGLFTVDTVMDENNGIDKMYKGSAPSIVQKETIRDSIIEVSKQTNSYGFLDVAWNDATFGHAMFYTVSAGGEIEVYDAQINERVDINELMKDSYDWCFTRTDNLEPDYDYIKAHNWTVYY